MGATAPTLTAPVAGGRFASERERRREQQIGDVADWYRTQVSYDDVKQSGREISVTVDYLHRVILVTSYEKSAHPFLDRLPPEARMEFDRDVLGVIQQGLQHKDHLVVVDTSDIPGYAPGGKRGEKSLAAKISVVDINSGDEVGTPITIAKPSPQLPASLQERLLGTPKMASNAEARDYVAERFFHTFLNSCIATGMEVPASSVASSGLTRAGCDAVSRTMCSTAIV